MKKIVVVSSNNSPDYLFYLPYITKAWHSYGWEVAVMLTHDVKEFEGEPDYVIPIPEIEGLRLETQAQASRLYAANHLPSDALIMTSDMDLLPLKDYWHPKIEDITNYGFDLTDFCFLPMGYTAMSGENWKKVMNLTGDTKADMLRDAHEPNIPHNPFSEDWSQYWDYDWCLLTRRCKPYMDSIVKVLRGRRPGSCFAFGRVDRGDSMQIPSEELIDCHAENNNVRHPDKLNKFVSLFERFHGKL